VPISGGGGAAAVVTLTTANKYGNDDNPSPSGSPIILPVVGVGQSVAIDVDINGSLNIGDYWAFTLPSIPGVLSSFFVEGFSAIYDGNTGDPQVLGGFSSFPNAQNFPAQTLYYQAPYFFPYAQRWVCEFTYIKSLEFEGNTYAIWSQTLPWLTFSSNYSSYANFPDPTVDPFAP
jgi:hypothetical protein